ncbi:MAG TPA: hypothetical protein VEA78_10250 [Acidimicrobiales bacterium]|nr:hypothetical protein [Acidimicrobiales bacterium]
MRRLVAALVVAVLTAAACSDGDRSTLHAAEDAMAELDAGDLVLELTASAPDGATVGFRMTGPYSVDGGEGDLPVFDVTYAQLLGETTIETQVLSTGEEAFVVVDGDATQLEGETVERLRLGDGEGFTGLGIAGWVLEPEEQRRGDDTVVSGRVDVADLFGDLSSILAQASGGAELAAPEGDAADRLRELVRESSAEVVVGDDDLPRTIDLTVDFGGEVPDELVDVLGPYAAATLTLHVELERIDGDLEVEAPAVSR